MEIRMASRTCQFSPRMIYQEQQNKTHNQEVDIECVRSCDNLAYLFTKAFPTTTFRKYVYGIRMQHLRDL
ncbi:hypothetical protein Bca101_092650 [Brassica carinata]